ncbi:hypothetical protein CO179_05630 [candidate division WWE3 bacterium CG_4_9_14_3_um_filter_39_7]|uniref:Type II secretion system protein GspG C-terminal domain-containing protein n=1 Tax=candidate division WWE3 bacterium CG_4_9_14_3_um_filter_39_7 TaxID=1975080 RepID=A0A2M7WZZ6_UNCKA|nr:MAG: hypothetical protein CO179_05630 [candidate division WWE3 bacterium CG_4_9_14_3_um_filter_39_7]
MPKRKSHGFTLIELIVVIVIIGLLAGIGIASFQGSLQNARTAKRLSDLKEINDALKRFYIVHGLYPVSGGGTGPWDGLYTNWGDSTPDWIPGLVPDYLEFLPRDPRNHTDPTQQYIYRSNDGSSYKLLSHVPEDCTGVVAKHPELNDPVRVCWAYGYSTPDVLATY